MKLVLTPTDAIADPAAFAALPEHSCSVPTGQTDGKRWKRARNTRNGDGWMLGDYEAVHGRPDLVRIRWRDLQVVS